MTVFIALAIMHVYLTIMGLYHLFMCRSGYSNINIIKIIMSFVPLVNLWVIYSLLKMHKKSSNAEGEGKGVIANIFGLYFMADVKLPVVSFKRLNGLIIEWIQNGKGENFLSFVKNKLLKSPKYIFFGVILIIFTILGNLNEPFSFIDSISGLFSSEIDEISQKDSGKDESGKDESGKDESGREGSDKNDTGQGEKTKIYCPTIEGATTLQKIGHIVCEIISSPINIVCISAIVILFTVDMCCYFCRDKHKDLKEVISGIGVLGTFVGVLMGLLYFDFTDVDGSISELLSGLKIAFISSVFGLGSSILLLLIQSFFPRSG